MPRYQIQAPNGKTYQIDGPAGASDDAVRTQVLAQFPEAAGGSPAPRERFQGLQASDAKKAWDDASADLERQIAGHTTEQKNRARTAFFNNPDIQKIRTAAATPVSSRPAAAAPVVRTKQQEIQDIARANVKVGSRRDRALATGATLSLPPLALLMQDPSAATAFLSSALDTTSFGLGDKLRAGLGSIGNGHSYEDNLALAREETKQRGEQSTTGNVLGMIAGSVPAAVTGGGLVEVGGQALGRVAPTLGRVIGGAQKMGVPEQLARAAVGGATAGAGEALGHDEDTSHGAGYGAAGALGIVGGGKVLGILGKQAAAVLNLGNAGAILKRLTTESLPEMQAKLAAERAKGYEPTLFELLNLKSRNNISSSIVNRSDSTLEQTQGKIGQRLANVGTEMASVTNNATAPGRQAVIDQITEDLTAARGTPAALVAEMPGDAAVAARATRDPLAMDALPGTKARLIMAPHDDRAMFNSIDEILPQHPELQDNGEVHIVHDDPAVTEMIRRKAGILWRKNSEEASGGITGRNVSDLLSDLRDTAKRGGTDADVAASAAQHIEEQLSLNHPDFLEAHGRMRDAYAADSRMGEGVTEGKHTRTRVSLAPAQVTQPVRNAYNSVEGQRGRFLGQANELQNTFTEASPRQAITGAATVPGNQAAIVQNLGPQVAAPIIDAAAAQTQGAQALAGLNAKKGAEAAALGPDDLAAALLGLNPASMIRTKVMAIHKFVGLLGASEKKSSALVEMLFSTNPAKRTQALNLLNAVPAGKNALSAIAEGLGVGGAAQQIATPPADAPEPEPVPQVDPAAAAPPEEAAELPADPAPPEEAAAVPVDPAAPEPPPTSAGIRPEDADLMAQIDNGDPQMADLMRQIRGAGAAPGQENAPGFHTIEKAFPGVKMNSGWRSEEHNREVGGVEGSKHLGLTPGVQAYDIDPQPGMNVHEAAAKIEADNPGVKVIEALAHRAKKPNGSQGGYHWHFALRYA